MKFAQLHLVSSIMGNELFTMNEGDNFIWICPSLVTVKSAFLHLVTCSYVMFYELFTSGEWGDFISMVFLSLVTKNSL